MQRYGSTGRFTLLKRYNKCGYKKTPVSHRGDNGQQLTIQLFSSNDLKSYVNLIKSMVSNSHPYSATSGLCSAR